jgi:mannose-6-phosphate isomerase
VSGAPGALRRLRPEFKEKVWGSTRLAPWYADAAYKVGEVWFTDPAGGGVPLPLLVKFIFTSENLSVQVHPDDEFAALHENSRGKTEMWHVLRADPGARIALGLRETVSKERLREASVSGEIEDLLRWHEAAPGDTYFVPAGTVHAIGSGLVICEIQQVSDVTYRLYDYGRPRELHLEKATAVSRPEPHPGKQMAVKQGDGSYLLAKSAYFRTELFEVQGAIERASTPEASDILIAIEGRGKIAGEAFKAGEAWLAPPEAPAYRIEAEGTARFLRTRAPSSE